MKWEFAIDLQPTPRILSAILIIVLELGISPATMGAAEETNLVFDPQPIPPASAQASPSILFSTSDAPSAARHKLAYFNATLDTDISQVGTGRNLSAILATIQAMELVEGPYAPSLAPQLIMAATLHRQERKFEVALAELSRSAQIARANFGLHTPEQFAAIDLSIEIYLEQHDYRNALDQQRALVDLHSSHYGINASESVPQLINLADMYFGAFERALHGNYIGTDLLWRREPESGFVGRGRLSRTDVAFLWLDQAKIFYVAGIEILLKRQDLVNPLLLDLESTLMKTLFLQAYRRELEEEPEFFMSVSNDIGRSDQDLEYEAFRGLLHQAGENSSRRQLSYLASNSSTTPTEIARVMLQLGDWHLLFGKENQSREVYAQGLRVLQAGGATTDEINLVFNPPLPVQLPTFIAQPHSMSGQLIDGVPNLDSDGHVDVAFTVNEHGKATAITVLNKSANVDRDIELSLRKIISNAPFRPSIAVTDELTSRTYEVRYAFARR